jgi:hypothetical protein
MSNDISYSIDSFIMVYNVLYTYTFLYTYTHTCFCVCVKLGFLSKMSWHQVETNVVMLG